MTYGQALRTLMKKQGVSQIELAPRLAVLSNGTVHLKDADQPSAGTRHHYTTNASFLALARTAAV